LVIEKIKQNKTKAKAKTKKRQTTTKEEKKEEKTKTQIHTTVVSIKTLSGFNPPINSIDAISIINTKIIQLVHI
jgi:hypothetical protein